MADEEKEEAPEPEQTWSYKIHVERKDAEKRICLILLAIIAFIFGGSVQLISSLDAEKEINEGVVEELRDAIKIGAMGGMAGLVALILAHFNDMARIYILEREYRLYKGLDISHFMKKDKLSETVGTLFHYGQTGALTFQIIGTFLSALAYYNAVKLTFGQ